MPVSTPDAKSLSAKPVAADGGFVYERVAKSLIPCPICGGTKFETLCRTDRYRMGVETSRCDSCGLVMTNPMPSEAALGEFYSTYYRYYYRKLERPDLSYIHRYSLDRRAIYTTAFLREQGLLPENVRVLDVGCGEGSILREIRLEVPTARAYGVEVYKPFATFAAEYSGCPMYPELSDVPAQPHELYDLVILSHVLEHVISPVAFLAKLGSLLKPGGKVFVDIPDVCHYHWLADLHIAHIYHFSPRTIGLAAKAAGLTVNVLQTHKPPKLPSCIRTIAGFGGAEAALPEGLPEEKAAAERIRGMHKFAGVFSRCFRFAMGVYEWSWTFIAHLPANKREKSVRVEPWAR